ncbi:MAG: 50S ribosomal protein L10 [Candidatus Nealsonbacteria bacterium]|nr:50S ribosomal protein L10 [Candidatus Nealsonbacteria bacterium]
MPRNLMALTKEQKQKILEDLREMFSRQKAIILVGITGLKVKDISKLRKKVKGIGASLKVVKKTLAEIVFKENKMDFEKDKLKQEIALVFSFENEFLLPKIVYEQRNQNLEILGGYFENSFKEAEEIITLAQLPSKDELMARLVRGLKTPISNFVNVLGGNIKGLIYVLKNIKT